MPLILVTGATGAGKTTYSIKLAKEIGAIRFSIDPWMQTLFAEDMKTMDYTWMMNRVQRCYKQIWEVTNQILASNGDVILDLGFTTQNQRQHFITLAKEQNLETAVHYIETPRELRKQRVKQRNQEKDPMVCSFDVTETMFNFMEPKYEIPSATELEGGKVVRTESAATA